MYPNACDYELFLYFIHLGSVGQQLCAHLRGTETSGIQRAGNLLTTGDLSVIAGGICFL